MKISTKGRYALRLMIDIGSQPEDQPVALRDVSERQGISVKYLEQIVPLLSRAGFLRSIRGAQGGYRLAKPAYEYTIGDILRVTEGTLAPITCLETETNECPRSNFCPTISFWEGLYRTVNQYVDSVTLADLLEQNASGGCEYFI